MYCHKETYLIIANYAKARPRHSDIISQKTPLSLNTRNNAAKRYRQKFDGHAIQ